VEGVNKPCDVQGIQRKQDTMDTDSALSISDLRQEFVRWFNSILANDGRKLIRKISFGVKVGVGVSHEDIDSI